MLLSSFRRLISSRSTVSIFRAKFCSSRHNDDGSSWNGPNNKNLNTNRTIKSVLPSKNTNAEDQPNSSTAAVMSDNNDQELQKINQQRIQEIMEYYSQYEKELMEGGYQDPDVEEQWLKSGDSAEAAEIYPISLERGREGVFDVEEMVQVLKHQKVLDVCCVKIPPKLQYADYMIVCTTYSLRHMKGVIQYILTLYKKKRGPEDPAGLKNPLNRRFVSPKRAIDQQLSGDNDDLWAALDFGNLIVHVMMTQARQKYDLEQLWALGPEFDQETQRKSEIDELEDEFEKFRRQIAEQKDNV